MAPLSIVTAIAVVVAGWLLAARHRRARVGPPPAAGWRICAGAPRVRAPGPARGSPPSAAGGAIGPPPDAAPTGCPACSRTSPAVSGPARRCARRAPRRPLLGGPATAGLATAVADAGRGQPLARAFTAWAAASTGPDERLAAGALALAATAGGPQARAVDGVAATLRERRAVAAEIRSQSAQARLSAIVIGALPAVFLVWAIATDRRTAAFLVAGPAGWACLGAGSRPGARRCHLDAPPAAGGGPMTALAAAWAALVLLLAWRWRPVPHRLAALVRDPAAARQPGPADALPAAVDRRRRRWRARAGLAGLIVASTLLGLLWPPLAVVPVTATVGRRRWARARRRRRAREEIDAALPDVIDLLVVAIGAGLTPTLAVRHLATLAPSPFAAAFAEVERRVDRGQRVADALDALVERLGDPARPLVAAVGGAERYGAPLAPTLEVLGHEARRERRRQAEERARTLPVKLCFPLVGCILPAFVLLTIAPLIAGAFRSLTV